LKRQPQVHDDDTLLAPHITILTLSPHVNYLHQITVAHCTHCNRMLLGEQKEVLFVRLISPKMAEKWRGG
jgi:hypothetical protein